MRQDPRCTVLFNANYLIHQISPYADQIVSLLPPLWEQSGNEHLMKQAILTLLSSLIHSMTEESIRYHSMILPLIHKSVEPGSVCPCCEVRCFHRTNALLGDSSLSA
jgi:hypothetical protein